MSDADLRPEIAAIIESIDELRPMLISRTREGDQLRRIPEDVFKAVADTGAFRVSAPTKFGGLAANTRESNAVARAIGRGDGGLAWVHGILDSGSWVVGLMDERAQSDVWDKDNGLDSLISAVIATTSEAERVEGGYRVTGRWGFGTGSLHADWSLLGIPLKNDDGEVIDAGLALIPTSELSYEDNWYIAGMKSSGSVTQIAEDVFVPEHRVLPVTGAVEGAYIGKNPEPTYQTAFIPSLFMKLVGPQLGMGRAALDYVIASGLRKGIAYTGYVKQADASSFQMAIAKASVQLSTAELVTRTVADEIYAAAERGHYPTYEERIEIRAKAGWVVETITNVIHELMTAHGSGGFAESSILQRMWRDQATAGRHGHTLPASGYDAFGKILVGREEDARFVLPGV